MKIRKLFSLILAGLMLSMVACNNNTVDNRGDDTSAGTQAGETEKEKTGYYYNIPEGVRYDDKTFTIMSYDSKKSWNVWLTGDGSVADTMNQAAYKRNLEIQDLLGVTIEQFLVTGDKKTAPYNLFVQQVMAGETDFDLFIPWGVGKLTALAADNLAYAWNELPVIDLTSPWYNQSANDVYSIGDRQFVAVSDITYTIHQHSRLLFNKGLFDKYQLEYPYEAVFNGTWDFDMMLSYAKDFYADLNNDGMAGPEDQFGLVTGSGHIGTYPYNMGHSVIKFDGDELVLNYYSERIADVISDLQALYSNPDVRMSEAGNEYQIFNEGRALMESYSSDPSQLRDIEFDFGYLPYPKYDASQEGYYTYTLGGVMVLPNVAQDFDFTGTVIEALAAGSNKYLVEAWVTNNIEGKVLRDDESVQIYRMMHDTAVYQLSQYFEPSGMIGYGEVLKSQTTGLASHYASVEEAIRTSYANYYDQVMDN